MKTLEPAGSDRASFPLAGVIHDPPDEVALCLRVRLPVVLELTG